jgi:hypothetical protein
LKLYNKTIFITPAKAGANSNYIIKHCCPIKNHGTFIFLYISRLNKDLACFSLFFDTILRIQ